MFHKTILIELPIRLSPFNLSRVDRYSPLKLYRFFNCVQSLERVECSGLYYMVHVKEILDGIFWFLPQRLATEYLFCLERYFWSLWNWLKQFLRKIVLFWAIGGHRHIKESTPKHKLNWYRKRMELFLCDISSWRELFTFEYVGGLVHILH